MRIFLYIIPVILLLWANVPAQISPGAKQVALSNSDVALSNDVFSIFLNPAGLSQLNWREIGIYYSPAPFGLKELANGYGAYHEPTKFGSFGIGFMTYGFDLYRENKFLLSYSNRVANNFFIGISLIYQTLTIQNYGSDEAFNFIFGGLAYLQKDLRIGFTAENLIRSTYGGEDNQIPIVFNTGLSYDILYNLSLNFAVNKEIDFPISLRFGMDYLIVKYLDLRIGFGNEPSSYSAGLGINYSIFSLDYAVFTHQDLGLTHQAGIIIHFGTSENRAEHIRSFLNFKN